MDTAILQEFEAIGVDLDADSLGKCCEICTVNNITDAEEFVEQWMAYSLTHFNGAEPTVTRLTEFQLKGCQGKEQPQTIDRNDDFRPLPSKRSRVSNTNSILNAYGYNDSFPEKAAPEPQRISDKTITSTQDKENEKSSAVSGQVVFSFGKAKKIADSKRSSPIAYELVSGMSPDEKYLFEMIPEKASYQREVLYNLGKEFTDKVKFQDSQKVDRFSSVDVPSQQTVHCIGRVCTEGDSKLTVNSTVLIGTESDTMRKVSLNLSKCPSYSIFPGQTVYVTGLNPNGTMLYAEKIHTEREIGIPSFPGLESSLDVVVAAGPFSAEDNLKYSSLEKLLSFCQNNNPDLLLLIGPLVDEANTETQVLNEGLESFFEKMVNDLMEWLKDCSVGTKVLMVSSQDDLNSSASFPTHPLTTMGNYPNLKMLSDPCQFSVDGVSFALTATDVLSHLNDAELVMNSGSDKVKRHVRHLFHQKSFYPLCPANEGVNMDVGLLSKYGRLRDIPNILILPSKTKPFVRIIDGCLALNPGKANPSYARLIINPKPSKDSNVMEFVSCQVINL